MDKRVEYDRVDLNSKDIFEQDAFIMIRGYPRKTSKVRFVEEQLGAKLVPDTKPSLLLQLDNALGLARLKMQEYPDYLVLPNEPLKLFVPIPFDVVYLGVVLQSYHKPAWFEIKRGKVVPALPWKK